MASLNCRRRRDTFCTARQWEHKATKINDIVDEVWDLSESLRFVRLALRAPDLLSFEDEVLWTLIRNRSELWTASPRTLETLDVSRLEADWDAINAEVAEQLRER